MKAKVTFLERVDYFLYGSIINWVYPEYYRPKYGYQPYYLLFFHYVIPQKLFRLNPKVKWPVHFTSKIIAPEKVTKGVLCDPGDSLNNYIQALNGIQFGHTVELGPGVQIISSNHDPYNFELHMEAKPIIIGNNVWIGANSTILPEVNIGNNVIIGAGSVVTKDIPSNSIAVGNPCKVIKQKKTKNNYSPKIIFNQTPPRLL